MRNALDSIGSIDESTAVRRGTIVALALLAVVAFWLRVRHLGALGLVLDEGLQGLAVRGILQHGWPELTSGLIYSRSFPFLYLEALAAMLFGVDEFSLRLPAVVFGVAVIFPAYWLGRMLFDWRVGLLTAAILAFSVWEIELSRFARFYTLFQFTYLLAAIFFYRGFVLDRRRDKLWFLLTAFLTITSHHLGGVVVSLFAIPWVSAKFRWPRKLVFALWAVAVYAMWKGYTRFIWLVNSLGSRYAEFDANRPVPPPETVRTWRDMLPIPSGAFPDLGHVTHLAQNNRLLFGQLAVIALAATAYLILRCIRSHGLGRVALAVAMVAFGVLHQFGMVLLLFLLYIVVFARSARSLWDLPLRVVYVAVALDFALWLSILAAAPGGTSQATVLALFGYPNLLGYLGHRFVFGWPVMAVGVAIGCVWLLARHVARPADPVPLFVLGAVFAPALAAGVQPAYREARYFFHLYPFLVLLFAATLMLLWSRLARAAALAGRTRQAAAAAAVVAALFVSLDASPFAAWSVGGQTYRSRTDPIRSITNLMPYASWHPDLKTPSLYVKERRAPGDTVIVFGSIFHLQIYEFYLGQVDYVVTLNRTGTWSLGDTRVATLTVTPVLDSVAATRQVVESSPGTLWILGDRMLLCEEPCHGFVGCGDALFGDCWHVYPEPIREYLGVLASKPAYVGLDETTFVVRLDGEATDPAAGALPASQGD